MPIHDRDAEGFAHELSALFSRYREACPDPEPGANFMPGVWQKIDARRSFSVSLRRLTRGFVTAAAAICLLMVILLFVPAQQNSAFYSSTYLDALATDHAPDTIVYAEFDHHDEGMLR